MDGSGSFDPDPEGGIVKYEWDFDSGQEFKADYWETPNFHPDGKFDGITTYTHQTGTLCPFGKPV